MNKRVFSNEEKSLIKNYYCYKHWTCKKISQELNCCSDLIYRFVKQNNLKKEYTNLIGNIYGKLTVVEDDGFSIFVICDCSCGKKNLALRRTDLMHGRIKSCGCLANKGSEMESLIGQKFGKLTVISDHMEKGKHLCLCQCDCGSQPVLKLASNLTQGHSKSCGCLKKERGIEKRRDLTGQRFGNLTAINIDEQLTLQCGEVYWNCLCDCGNKIGVRASKLTSQWTQSCGCIKSIGEKEISQILRDNKIEFKNNQSYKLRFPSGHLAFFDFIVYQGNSFYIIEFDGSQHYYKHNTKWDKDGKFEKRQEYDKIKNDFCLSNNIPLIRIPFSKLHKITIEDLNPKTTKYLIKE